MTWVLNEELDRIVDAMSSMNDRLSRVEALVSLLVENQKADQSYAVNRSRKKKKDKEIDLGRNI